MPPSVFISYSRHDGRDHADALQRMLEGAGVRAWRDQRSQNPYADYSTEIEGAIRDATHVVVCVTPSIERNPGSFVRREIIYAEGKGKPILPLVFDGSTLPVLVNHLTWLPVPDLEEAFPHILARLERTAPVPRPDDDPCRPFLLALLNQVVAFLDATTFTVIPLRARPDPGAGPPPPASLPVKVLSMPLAVRDAPLPPPDEPEEFTDFAAAFERFGRSVLLLGEPGAGKTTTLWTFAREALLRRLADPAQPLPLLAQIPTWDAEAREGLVDWLASSIGGLERGVLERAVLSRNVLLLLDGLDELGARRVNGETGEEYDPRARFAAVLPPGVPRVITCRLADFRTMRRKFPANGAVVLQPLDDADIAAFLHERPEVLALVESDRTLLEVVRTPLLLSLLTYALSSEEPAELTSLENGDRRDHVFELYVSRRYAHEAARANARLPFTLDETLAVLSHAAMNAMIIGTDAHVAPQVLQTALADLRGDPGLANAAGLSLEEVATGFQVWNPAGERRFLPSTWEPFAEFAARLHLLVVDEPSPRLRGGESTSREYRFFHLLLRDFLAFRGALAALRDPGCWTEREHTLRVLDSLANPRAVEPLLDFLRTDGGGDAGRFALSALGKIGDPRAFPVIVRRVQAGTIPDDEAVRKGKALDRVDRKWQRQIRRLRRWQRRDNIFESGVVLARVAPGVDALAALLSDPDTRIRELAAWAFGHYPERRYTDAEILIGLFSDPDAGVREAAARAFTKIADPRAVPGLIALLRDPAVLVREAAAWALGESGSPAALQPLLKALKSWRMPVRNVAAEALGKLGDSRAVPWLIRAGRLRFVAKLVAGRSINTITIKNVMRALGALQDGRAFPFLEYVLRNGRPEEQEVAVEALGALGDPRAVPLLEETLRQDDRFVARHSAADALAAIPGPDATRALARAYLTFDLVAAAEALLERKDPAAVEPLYEYLAAYVTGANVTLDKEKPWMVLAILRGIRTPEALAVSDRIVGEVAASPPAGAVPDGEARRVP